MALITYKCPNCGGRIEFDSSLQMMKCPFCDSTFDVAQLRNFDAALNAPGAPPSAVPDSAAPSDAPSAVPGSEVPGAPPGAPSSAVPGSDVPGAPPSAAPDLSPPQATERIDWQMPSQQWEAGEQDNMYVYACTSCGGEIISDATLGATSCPYCGNPVIMGDKFYGSLKPDVLIPFRTDKAEAKAALLKHYEGKPYLPKAFKDENFINEIKGVYVPYWLFDANCHVDGLFKCSTVETWSDSENNYTRTKYYAVERAGIVGYQCVPVDGSQKLADDLMESIEPFDFRDLREFQSAYLAGYFANRFDVDAASVIPLAEQRMTETATELLRASVSAYNNGIGVSGVGYSSVTVERTNVAFSEQRSRYALLPVWLLATTFKGTVYNFAMNGQTGLLIGDLPVDKGAYWRSFALWGCLISIGLFILAVILLLWLQT